MTAIPPEDIRAAAQNLRDIIDGAPVILPARLRDQLGGALNLLESIAFDAVNEAVKAERQRVCAELGNDHYVIFTADGWTTEHSVECRLSGHMHECDTLKAVRRIADEPRAGYLGRWRIDGIDSEGLPSLVRAEMPGETP